MKSKIFFVLFLAVVSVGSWTCKKDSDDDNNGNACSINWASDLGDEINALSTAAQTYLADPTYENCIAYKNAAQAYLDALEPYGNCPALTGQNRVEWQNAIDEAQESLDNLDC
jgi:hypothetical protein